VPELGSHGSVRGARGNSRPYRESRRDPVKPTRMTHCRHGLHRWVRPKIYSLADLLGGLMSTINAATICIAAAKANGTT